MPQFLSPDAQSLLRMLFKRNPANRLGELERLDTSQKLLQLRFLKIPLVFIFFILWGITEEFFSCYWSSFLSYRPWSEIFFCAICIIIEKFKPAEKNKQFIYQSRSVHLEKTVPLVLSTALCDSLSSYTRLQAQLSSFLLFL